MQAQLGFARRLATGAALALLALGASGCGYNRLVTQSEAVDAAWSEVQNQLQRRNDLIPNLVNTVKGFAAQEQNVLVRVTEARSRVAGAGTPAETMAASNELSGALSRLLVVASRDRKIRFWTGYGLEGVLPDGKLGRILDETAIPAFRRGALGEGIVAALQAAAGEIAAAAGVELTGVAPRAAPRAPQIDPRWLSLLVVLILLLSYYFGPPPGMRGRRRYRPVLWGGGLGGIGSGGFGGGFRGGGGFGGGGGGFGGGGAGRSW